MISVKPLVLFPLAVAGIWFLIQARQTGSPPEATHALEPSKSESSCCFDDLQSSGTPEPLQQLDRSEDDPIRNGTAPKRVQAAGATAFTFSEVNEMTPAQVAKLVSQKLESNTEEFNRQLVELTNPQRDRVFAAAAEHVVINSGPIALFEWIYSLNDASATAMLDGWSTVHDSNDGVSQLIWLSNNDWRGYFNDYSQALANAHVVATDESGLMQDIEALSGYTTQITLVKAARIRFEHDPDADAIRDYLQLFP